MDREWCEERGVSCPIVAPFHVQEFLDAQGDIGIRPGYKLMRKALYPGQFEKMKVSLATTFFSEETAQGILLAVEKGLISPSAKTTGLFFLETARWYKIISSRDMSVGADTSERGQADVVFVQNYIESVRKMTFWRMDNQKPDNTWKPVQTGVIMHGEVALKLREKVAVNGPMDYLLFSRLFSSSAENLFSQARAGGDAHPRPVHLRHVMRLISVAQHIRASSRG